MRLVILATCILFALMSTCRAQGEKAKPNTLTPKEIADGWLLLFDGETTFGWKSLGEERGFDAKNGTLNLSSKARAEFTTAFGSLEVESDYLVKGQNGGLQLYREGEFGNASINVSLISDKEGEWGHLKVRVAPDGLQLWRQRPGSDKTETEKLPFGAGRITITIRPGDKDSTLSLRNFKLRPINTKSPFNGKNLTGWTEFPGKKSTFKVIDGAINVKYGPGDLQTTGKYQDFVLQLEAISNGKHFNSGIFFRCKPNEYQNGYEAQIFNKFSKEPTQKYTVEEYDPTTHKLLAKKQVMSAAFDFGTGAVYRRVPARKEMSKDGEWFGMTIAAHGNHLATWVNGVQVTDWTDNRPRSDNARIGCKLEAGHISIQGHDPTTDLSFRNFRIAEMPAK